MPLLDALRQPAVVVASGTDGPTSAAIGLPIILALVAVVVVVFLVYVLIRRR